MSDNINYAAPEEGFVAPFPADEESPYIFISYAHEDRELVFPIITRLYEQGWRVWYDQGIPPATNYNEVIASHIAECALFLMFVTQTACERPYVINNEVEYAIRCKPEQIMLCFLEEDIVMPYGADMLLGGVEKPKFPKVKESELESVLAGVEGLEPGDPREARPFEPDSGTHVVTADGTGEYKFVNCTGGVRLTKYLGSDTDVVVPAEYPAGSGQKVVELMGTFYENKTVRTIRLPVTVKAISFRTFSDCNALTDVYIPSSVTECYSIFGWDNNHNCTLHCAEGSAALEYAKEENIPYEIDNSLAMTDEPAADAAQSAYAYISYSADISERAAEIIGALEQRNCTVTDGSRLSGTEVMKAVRECACFVALVSRSYLAGEDVECLRTAQAMNKQKLIYVLEACELPPDLSIESESQQQLRYDALSEEQRTAKLVEWLQKNGCRRASADIPDFEYTATAEGGITLTKYTGSGGNVVIEREYGDPPYRLPVTSIGRSAFRNCSSLTGITIPDSVTSIGRSAFRNCSSLTGITIPDRVTNIGDSAFSGCSNLTGITIPDSVTSIGDCAFYGCSSLTGITIPDGVTSVGYWAFQCCSSLTAINVSEDNRKYCDIHGVLFSKDKTVLIAYPNAHGSEYVIPESVTSIGDGAFRGCSNLTGITIPDSVTSIGNEAFDGCSSLTIITIPDSVTSIDFLAFYGCPTLTVYCPENSYAWQYCEENGIRHEPLAAAEPGKATEPAAREETLPTTIEEVSAAPAEAPAENPAVTPQESAPTPRKKSPARWLVPLLILLALAAAAGLQVSGVVDILGLLGL